MPDYQLEQLCTDRGYKLVCGVDEAGRGPLSGPVFAAAVILPAGLYIEGLNDSKKLTPKKRDALFDTICREAVTYGIASASVEEIDEMNILEADLLAMRRAIARSHGDSTVILIAQRVSSVMGMDHILVMDNGRCIGYGSHGELLENCPPYREIYETQMGAME